MYKYLGNLTYIDGFGTGIHLSKDYCLIRKTAGGYEILERLLYDDHEGFSPNDFKAIDPIWFFPPGQKLKSLR